MTQLTNLSPAASYGDLLTTTNGGQGLSSTLQNLQDGLGNNSPAQIATNAFNFNRTGGRTFQLDGVPLTVSATILNELGPSIATGTLTPAQVYAMNGASILVLEAPGPGTMIAINKIILSYEHNTVAYTGGGLVYLQYSANGAVAGNDNASEIISAAVLTGGVSRISSKGGQIGDLALLDSALVINSPVCITNETAPFATGDGNVSYYILYNVITL